MAGWPWTEPPGRFSPFKLAVFIALFIPGVWTAVSFALGMLGPRPLTEAIDQIGLWTIRFFFISLAITPARQILQWPELLLVRRMIGVAAFTYAAVHISLYAIDEKLMLLVVGSEIVRRIYLTIGFTALIGLGVLAATSTDGMLRRLGSRRWQKLHAFVYGIGVLAVIHMFMQSKADVQEATWMAGVLAWLLGYRVLGRLRGRGGRVPLWWAGALSVAAAIATSVGEAGYFWWKMGVAPTRVLAVNLSLVAGIRPGWIVLFVGLALSGTGAAIAVWRRRPARRAMA
jgi:methionine sulfoxide reductase heme-binding subunit